MEMTPDECTEQVSRLLGLFPGVDVLSAVHSERERKTFVVMRILSLPSLASIVHTCNCGANVSLRVNGTECVKPPGKPVDERKLRYSIEIQDDDGRGSFANPPGPLHILGAFLTRDLVDLGLLGEAEARELQSSWHCLLASSL